jgi:hypothetical protein
MSHNGAALRAAVPISNARAEASRKNGAKSRGPKTPEGKVRSAQNALKHRMRAQNYVVLPEEDAGEFAELAAALTLELAPVGALQSVLARRIAVAAWRLPRADRIETELFEERSCGPNATPGLTLIRDGNGTRSFETLLRYRSAAMAEFWRALKTLKALQAEQAVTTGPALAMQPVEVPPKWPTARPSLVRQPNEPDRAAGRSLPYAMPDQPPPGRALHEPAAPWTPKEPETGPGRLDGVGARGPNEPQAAPEPGTSRRRRKLPEPSAFRKPNEPNAGRSWRRARRLPRAYCVAAGGSVTRMMRFVLLWWIRRSPSRVGRMWRTMPAWTPPEGIGQLWNSSVRGSKRTSASGRLPDSLYQTMPSTTASA